MVSNKRVTFDDSRYGICSIELYMNRCNLKT